MSLTIGNLSSCVTLKHVAPWGCCTEMYFTPQWECSYWEKPDSWGKTRAVVQILVFMSNKGPIEPLRPFLWVSPHFLLSYTTPLIVECLCDVFMGVFVCALAFLSLWGPSCRKSEDMLFRFSFYTCFCVCLTSVYKCKWACMYVMMRLSVVVVIIIELF